MIVPITAGAALPPSVVFLLVPVSTFSAGGEAGGAEGTGGGASGKGEAGGGDGEAAAGGGGDGAAAAGGGGGGGDADTASSGGDGDGGGGEGAGLGGAGGGEGGGEGGGIGGKMSCCTSTERVLLSRPRLSATAEVTLSVDKLPARSALASSGPPCLVTESSALTLRKVLLVTFTPLLAASCGISVMLPVMLPSLSERENVTVPVLPLSTARRRLKTSVAVRVQLGEMAWHATFSSSAASLAFSPTS